MAQTDTTEAQPEPPETFLAEPVRTAAGDESPPAPAPQPQRRSRGGFMGGVIGGVLGAYVLTGIDGAMIKPFIIAYLILLALFVAVPELITIPMNFFIG